MANKLPSPTIKSRNMYNTIINLVGVLQLASSVIRNNKPSSSFVSPGRDKNSTITHFGIVVFTRHGSDMDGSSETTKKRTSSSTTHHYRDNISGNGTGEIAGTAFDGWCPTFVHPTNMSIKNPIQSVVS